MTNTHDSVDEITQADRHDDYCDPRLTPADSLSHNGGDVIDTAEERRTPLPKFQLFLVFCIQFAEPITALVIYPFVNQFVRETGITKGDDRKTGYYAGIIESVFFFAEAATVFQWGWLSDRIGRRPVLLLGPLGLTFAMLKFGISTSFWSLVWTRCFQGIFNGNIGVSKTVMVELTDETNIGDAFAMMPLMWSIGTTIAPIMGGILSNPATRWPGVFGKIPLFETHPYLLPCLVSATVAFLSFVIAFFGFKETLPSIINRENQAKAKKIDRDPEVSRDGSADTLLSSTNGADYGTTGSTRCHSPASSGSSLDSCRKLENSSTDSPTLRSVLKSKTLQLIIINYILLTFTDACYNVLIPLIYSTPIELGGLGFNPYQIGLIMGIWGLLNAFVQINLLGKAIRKYGASRVYKIAYSSYAVCFLTFPISTYLARRNGSVGVGTCISIFVQLSSQFLPYMSYGAIHVVIAETTPKPVLGSINGIVQMTGCTMRTIGPVFASSLFSVSLEKRLMGGNFVYVVLYAVVVVGIRSSLSLPQRNRKSASR